ncbi:MAG TPA: hypothetical protein VEK32_16600 [Thermodesulfobacteriota bacterium]|nr:hypothetical protein [Thermodesulfobacteriota bacterium]
MLFACRIFFGLFFSLVIGEWVTTKFLNWIRGRIKENAKQIDNVEDHEFESFSGNEYFPPRITGTLERLFFVLLVGFDVSGTAIAMILWVAVKMAAEWFSVIQEQREAWKMQVVFSALLGNVVSLLFALVAGLVFRWKI